MLQSRPGITKASWAAVLECVWPHALQTCVSVMSPYSYAAWSMKLGITKRKAAHSSHTQWSVISLWKVFPSLSWSVRNRFCLLRSGPWIGAVCSGTLFEVSGVGKLQYLCVISRWGAGILLRRKEATTIQYTHLLHTHTLKTTALRPFCGFALCLWDLKRTNKLQGKWCLNTNT